MTQDASDKSVDDEARPGDPAAGAEPVVAAAVAAPAEGREELTPDDDESAVDDPVLLGAALRQELEGDGGAGARRLVILIGVVMLAALVTMVFHALRAAPSFDETEPGARSSRVRASSSAVPARKRTARPRPVRGAPTTPASASSAP